MYDFMRQVTRETENNTNELLSPPCPCGTENISSSQCMWDAGILNGSHGRKLLRFVTFQPLQRRIGNGQGAERHSLIKGRGVSPGRCLLDNSGFEGVNLISFDVGLFLMTATAILAIVLLILRHAAAVRSGTSR